MPRTSHHPPRFPPTFAKEDKLPDLIRFPSLDTILEELPAWPDDLLTDSDVNSKGTPLRRSVSDSSAILDVSANLQCAISYASEEIVPSLVEIGEGSEICSGFEGSCVYGPNSPRQKSNLTKSEVNALMESMPRNKLQYVTVDLPTSDLNKQSDAKGDFQISAGNLDSEKAARRRSGHRSRVRKLQYIAELERNVELYQIKGADLAARVASLFQQRVVLSVENRELRWQIAVLRQEKLIKDGQNQYLKNEAEKLKMICPRHR